MNATRLSISCLSLSVLLGVYAVAQDKKKADTSQRETVARPMTEKERKKKEDKLRKELETPYRKWLNEDVAYIISDEERTAFKRFQTDTRLRCIRWRPRSRSSTFRSSPRNSTSD